MFNIFGIFAIVAFAIALILDLAGVSKGHLNDNTFIIIIGLLCLAVHVTTGWWGPVRRGGPQP